MADASTRTRRTVPEELGILGVLVVVLLVFVALSPSFRSVDNGLILLLNGAVIAFLALGQTFVLLTGGIDLSTGANVAMSGVLVALYMQGGIPWIVAFVMAIATGGVFGLVNGLVVHFLRLPPFIATFGTMGVASSIPLILTGANSVSVSDQGFSVIGQGYFLGVPVPVALLVLAVVLAALFLRRTRQGLWIYALGGNGEAARLAGVQVARTTLLVYTVSGACGGIAGSIATSRLMVGFPATGLGNELFFSIAAAVVGGVSLFGGIGSVSGAMIGAVLIATVSNGLNVLNVNSYWQSLVIGLIILAGVSFDTFRRGRTLRALRVAQTSRSRTEVPPLDADKATPEQQPDGRTPAGSTHPRRTP